MERQDTSAVLWFVAGIAIGATVGILFAPQSGEETRRRIGDKAREGRDKLNDQGRALMDRGREFYDRGRQIADEAAGLFEEGRRLVQR
jgi:gas vesicle protein